MFELGRCFQFLLDSDWTKYTLTILSNLNINKIIKKAYKLYGLIMVKKYKWNLSSHCNKGACDICDNGNCYWVYGESRCACGDRKFRYRQHIYGKFSEKVLDQDYPHGFL